MGSKILLADDSITIQKVVNLTFADEGIEVISVSNGDMAERRLQEVDPDLVLADIFMPGKNGYELCEAIKQNAQFRDVPVVLLVGAFEPFNESEARRVRADAHLTKPFESRVLVETVKSLIERNPRRRSVPQVATEVFHQVAAPEPPPFQNIPAIARPDIDLSAMSTPFQPQESVFADRVSTSGFGDSTPFADSFPNNFDFSQNPSPGSTATLDFSVDLSPSTSSDQSAASVQETQVFSTFEPVAQAPLANAFQVDSSLQTPEAPATPQDPGIITGIFGTPVISNSTDVAPSNNFDVLDHFVNPVEEPAVIENPVANQAFASSDNQTANVVVDYDKVDPIQQPIAQELPSFEVDLIQPSASAASEYAVAEVQETESQDTRNIAVQATQKFDTNELESPVESAFIPTLRDTEYGSNGNGVNSNSANEATQSSTDFAFYQNSTEQEPSLLSTDEPLGDVFNDFLLPDAEPQEAVAPLAVEPPVAASQEPQMIETPAPAVSEPATQLASGEPDIFSSFTSGSEVAAAVEQASEVAVEETVSQDFSFVAPSTEESLPVIETETAASGNNFEVVIPPKVEPIQVETAVPSSTQFNFYTEPQEEKASEAIASEPVHEAVPAQKATADEGQNQAEKFTASDMWEAETQFTPVSIEPVPVVDLPVVPVQDVSENQADAVAAPVAPVESSSPSFGTPVEVAPHTDENHLEKTTPKEVEMNKEMMDEIVRQVVAQLSDSVIREIAWEVVPDCVERVVTNLTKQDLVKRL
jgi:CheY-like chemotaxis protein